MSEHAKEIVRSIIDIQDSIVRHARTYRGQTFHISHWEEITGIKQRTPYDETLSKHAIIMYRKVCAAHYESFKSMTDTIDPHDEPWLENIQAPPLFALFKEQYPDFCSSVDKLCEAIQRDENGTLERSLLARYTGQYGPVWIFGPRNMPGTQEYLYLGLTEGLDIPRMHRTALTYPRVTSYSNLFGRRFAEALHSGCKVSEALQAEKDQLIEQWRDPVGTQKKLMDELGVRSYDPSRYMDDMYACLKDEIAGCVADGISFNSIVYLISYAGDLHHVGQMIYNMCKDDMSLAIIESVARSLEYTLEKNIGKFDHFRQIPVQEVTAAATARILHMDGFRAADVEALLERRHRRLAAEDPRLYMKEDMNELFVRFLREGEAVLKSDRENPVTAGGFPVNLEPVFQNPVINDPANYTWAQLPITNRFGTLMKFADEPFMLITDPAFGPIWACNCADPSRQ